MPVSAVVSMHSALKKDVDKIFQRLNQGGFSEYYLRRTLEDIRSEWVKAPSAAASGQGPLRGYFGLEQFRCVPVAWEVGIVISALVLAVECIARAWYHSITATILELVKVKRSQFFIFVQVLLLYYGYDGRIRRRLC